MRIPVKPEDPSESGARIWVGDEAIVASGTILLRKGQKQFRILYDDLYLDVYFSQGMPDGRAEGALKHVDNLASVWLEDTLYTFGSYWSWTNFAALEDGRKVSLSVYIQTVGPDVDQCGRLITYSYTAV